MTEHKVLLIKLKGYRIFCALKHSASLVSTCNLASHKLQDWCKFVVWDIKCMNKKYHIIPDPPPPQITITISEHSIRISNY